MHSVLLIGAGQLGSRHLQSLARLDIPVSIKVIDPGREQLKMSRERFEQVPGHEKIHRIDYRESLHDVPSYIDLCIIATKADVRSSVTRQVIETANVKNIIFEKVLFQSLADYDEIEKLLADNNIRAWVNCPRRMYPIYQEIKSLFHRGERISYHLNGGEWGLACNSIHLIDHVAYFTGETDYEVDISHLDKELRESKRKGFIEVSGTLGMTFRNGSELILHSKKDSGAPDMISILGERYHAVVFESAGRAMISDSQNYTDLREIGFKVPYQSELTHLAAREVLLNGNSGLTEFSQSVRLHKPILKALMQYMEKVTGHYSDKCPIT